MTTTNTQPPSIGRILHYRLSEQDAEAINRRRKDALAKLQYHRAEHTGVVVHIGNPHHEDDVVPMIVTRIWGATTVNGQALLDGNDTLWVTSVSEGEGPRTWSWPPRV